MSLISQVNSDAESTEPLTSDTHFATRWIFGWSCLSAILAAIGLGFSLRYGIRLTPDGWRLWQGSVSILQGQGYRSLFGDRLIAWMPLYSGYLALVQKMLDVSGRSIALANLALGVLAAFSWTAALLLPLRHARLHPGSLIPMNLYAAFLVVFVSCTIVNTYVAVFPQNWLFAVMPWTFYLAFATMRSKSRDRFLALSTANALLVALQLQIHNSAVLLLAPLSALLLLGCRQHPMRQRLLAILLLEVIALTPWYLVRAAFGQLHSHRMGLHVSDYSMLQYAHQFINSLSRALGPDRFRIGQLLLLLICLWIAIGLLRRQSNSILRRAAMVYLVMALGFAAGLFLLFNIVWINEPLSIRYLVLVPLTLVPVGVLLHIAADAPSSAPTTRAMSRGQLGPRSAITAMLAILLCALIAGQAALRIRAAQQYKDKTALAYWQHDQGFAFSRLTIAPAYIDRPATMSGNLILVSPPKPEWMVRRRPEAVK